MPFKFVGEGKLKLPWEDKEYFFGADTSDVVEIEGYHTIGDSNIHCMIKALVRHVDGKWEPYPSVILIDDGSVDDGYGLYTAWFALREDVVTLLQGPYGHPDGKLLANANSAGVLTAVQKRKDFGRNI